MDAHTGDELSTRAHVRIEGGAGRSTARRQAIRNMTSGPQDRRPGGAASLARSACVVCVRSQSQLATIRAEPHHVPKHGRRRSSRSPTHSHTTRHALTRTTGGVLDFRIPLSTVL